ncbi:MAG: Hint domain-containing protein [Albidovulum sp.]|uniref:Hint domain-containing protein n=1 Tax=Albidovulum sp. TaxID=1872424 RepID=UPI00132A9ABF|nr:Hint domain-containing protein [Defluviimonas sp.]KAB2885600.1 MAG: Hint domain-containing protein [Defluviimonas sp.]
MCGRGSDGVECSSTSASGARRRPHTPCFGAGSRIATQAGPVAIEALCVGDMVLTRDNGFRPIRWIGGRAFGAAALNDFPELRPVRIRRGAFGSDVPSADLLVSPQHRVLLSGHHVPVESAEAEILAAATDLVTLGLAEVEETATVTYYHMMFDQHEIVWADGCWSESFLPEAAALDGLHDAQLREILTIFPELATRAGQRAYLPARRMLSLDPREPARIAPRAA